MNKSEALKFAQERLDKISYQLEMSNHLPCRSFYEKQEEMLVCALSALQDQSEREKGCKYCNKEKSFEIHYDGEKAGRAWLHKGSDGWALFLEIDGEPVFYMDVNACPICGRDLRKPEDHAPENR